MADKSGNRKRMKEIKEELAALKQKMSDLKTERDALRAKLQAGKADTAKPSSAS